MHWLAAPLSKVERVARAARGGKSRVCAPSDAQRGSLPARLKPAEYVIIAGFGLSLALMFYAKLRRRPLPGWAVAVIVLSFFASTAVATAVMARQPVHVRRC
jgi:hypothetical protein